MPDSDLVVTPSGNERMTRQVDVKAIISHIVRGDGTEKCRICMGDTSSGQVHLSDTVMLDGDRPVTLSELLENVSGIEVTTEPELPPGICPQCVGCALNAAHFRQLCHNAATQWRTTILLVDSISSFLPESDEKSIYCLLNNRMIIEDFQISKNLQTAADRLTLLLQSNEVNDESDTTENLDPECSCPDCEKSFLSPYFLFVHLKEASHEKRACYVCAKIVLRGDLVKHLHKHGEKPYICKQCRAIFRTNKTYEVHLKKDHVNGRFTCVECKRSFVSSPAYCAHKAIHDQKVCPGCAKTFLNQKCYVHHVQICSDLHKARNVFGNTKRELVKDVDNKNDKQKIWVGSRGSANKKCYCDHCGKQFAGKRFVSAHIQIVHMRTTHKPCVLCGKHYAAARMADHVKSHQSNIFNCGYCGLALKTKLGYMQHIRLHTGEKPYACQQCGETFSASSRKSEHMRKVHKTTAIPLNHCCDLCPAKFRLPYRLKKHMSSAHGVVEKDFLECSVCGLKFSSSTGLVHHEKKHQLIGDSVNQT